MDAKDKWNRKYKDRLNNHGAPEPNERLLRIAKYLNGGAAIDYAAGLGGNSLFLAEKGYDMTAIDISDVAINFIKDQADLRNLKIDAKLADLTKESTTLTSEKFDLAIITYYLDRSLFPLVKQVIKEDGYLFYETFYKNGAAGNGHVSNQYKLDSNELLNQFRKWKVLFFEECEEEGRQTIFCQKIHDASAN